MTNTRTEFDAAVATERKSRLAVLRRTAPNDLRALSPLSAEKVQIRGKPITFTTYVEKHDDDRRLVLVRSDESRFFWYGEAWRYRRILAPSGRFNLGGL